LTALIERSTIGLENQRAGPAPRAAAGRGQLSRQPVAEMIEPHQAQRLDDLRRISALGTCASRAERDVLGHVMCGTEHSSGIRGRRCASMAAVPVMSVPPRRTLPDVGSMKPATMRKVVVLPQPEGRATPGTRHRQCIERNVIRGLELAVALGDARVN